MRWPTTFIPEEDDGYFLVSTQLPPAASLNRTEAVGKQIDKILDSYPEVKTYIGVNGSSIMGGGELSNAGTYFVILKNWNERKGKEHTASAVVNRFNREAYGIQEAQIFAMVPPAIPDWELQEACNSSWRTVKTWDLQKCNMPSKHCKPRIEANRNCSAFPVCTKPTYRNTIWK